MKHSTLPSISSIFLSWLGGQETFAEGASGMHVGVVFMMPHPTQTPAHSQRQTEAWHGARRQNLPLL